MAALTCKRWLNAFCSPNVWRKFTYYSPPQGLTRLQYDLKTYYMARGIRAIGWHLRYLRFPETEDFFMLNRILSLIAEFLEAHPNNMPLPTDPILSDDDNLFSELAFLEAATLMTNATTPTSSSSEARGAEEEQEERDVLEEETGPVGSSSDPAAWEIDRDPDLDATIRLALELQQRDYLEESSFSSSSSESGVDFYETPSTAGLSSSAPQHFPFRSASTTEPALPPAQARGRKYQRSASCRYPAGYVMPTRLPYPPDTSHLPPPRIRSFSLDFHSEYDEATNVVYGSGGAIFATICRVLYQCRGLRSLYLRNLFLSPQDARRMIMEVNKVAGPTLERLSLLHVCKLAPEHSSPEASHPLPPAWQDEQLRHFVWGKQRDPYWYLHDPRWLSARPKHLGWNPLADLHYLFPNLHQLELSLSQLTGPMLLRLLFQTRLSLLIFVQTDLSPRLTTYDPYEAAPPRVHYVDSLENLGEIGTDASDTDRSRDPIDWGADVPTSESFPHRVYTLDWRPIDPEFWRQARALRSNLRVELKFRFLRWSTPLLSFALPALPAPVTSAVCVFGGSDQLSSYRLFERCLATLSRYSSTLTSLVFFVEVDLEALEAKEREEAFRPSRLTLASFRSRRQFTPTKDIVPKPVDEQLLKLLSACPYVSSLSLGGRLLNIHLTTLGQICRLLVGASRQTPPPSAPQPAVRPRRPELCVDCASVRLSGDLPDCTSARDSGIFTQLMQDCRGKEASPAAKARAAECFISASLGVPRWRFMQSTEYRHHVNVL